MTAHQDGKKAPMAPCPSPEVVAKLLGCAKTKSDLVVMLSGRQIFAFFFLLSA
jgi:hypothetical protein